MYVKQIVLLPSIVQLLCSVFMCIALQLVVQASCRYTAAGFSMYFSYQNLPYIMHLNHCFSGDVTLDVLSCS